MSQEKTILITGSVGYIGSHVVRQLGETGETVVVLDNLSTGFKESVLSSELIIDDTGDRELVSQILEKHNISSVMHFAAHIIVPESVSNPLKYYGNNTCNSHNLLECCAAADVEHFIFSSTAAVYGIPNADQVIEDTPTAPINAYGSSKLTTGQILKDLSFATNPPQLIAKMDAIHAAFDWNVKYNDLDMIIKTSLDWEKKLLDKASS